LGKRSRKFRKGGGPRKFWGETRTPKKKRDSQRKPRPQTKKHEKPQTEVANARRKVTKNFKKLL